MCNYKKIITFICINVYVYLNVSRWRIVYRITGWNVQVDTISSQSINVHCPSNYICQLCLLVKIISWSAKFLIFEVGDIRDAEYSEVNTRLRGVIICSTPLKLFPVGGAKLHPSGRGFHWKSSICFLYNWFQCSLLFNLIHTVPLIRNFF